MRVSHAEKLLRIAVGSAQLEGNLSLPEVATGVVLFAHGSGSSRHSSRNQRVARVLRDVGLATLLFDLLTPEEEEGEALTAHLRFDIEFLASRLRLATQWAIQDDRTASLRMGYFGASTGAAGPDCLFVIIGSLKFLPNGDGTGGTVCAKGNIKLSGTGPACGTAPYLRRSTNQLKAS